MSFCTDHPLQATCLKAKHNQDRAVGIALETARELSEKTARDRAEAAAHQRSKKVTAHPPLYGLGGTYLEGEAAVLRDRQNVALEAATERVSHFTSGAAARDKVIAIAAVDSYLRSMRAQESE
jgi:hypothetical protein